MVCGFGFRVSGFGRWYLVSVFGLWVSGSSPPCRALMLMSVIGFGYKLLGIGARVSDMECRVLLSGFGLRPRGYQLTAGH